VGSVKGAHLLILRGGRAKRTAARHGIGRGAHARGVEDHSVACARGEGTGGAGVGALSHLRRGRQERVGAWFGAHSRLQRGRQERAGAWFGAHSRLRRGRREGMMIGGGAETHPPEAKTV